MRFDDAFQALVELSASRHNAFHSSEAADIPAHRLRRAEQRGKLTRLGSRVWSITALGSPPGQRLRAATLATSAAAACHRGSGWLHGWLCLLGRVEPDEVVESCLDRFLQVHSRTWLIETLDRLWADNGAGPTALRRLLNHPARRAGRVESGLERRVQRILAGVDLPPMVLQHVLAVGGHRYRIDLAMPSIKLGVESHGRRFHWGRKAEEADNQRDLALATAGWQLLYVTWDQLQDPTSLCNKVVAAANARVTPA